MDVSGTMPLTTSLLNSIVAGDVSDHSPENVVPYLKKNLHWRIQTTTGAVPQVSDVESLKIQVSTSVVELPNAQHDLPAWGPMVVQYNVTDGRAGGISQGENLIPGN